MKKTSVLDVMIEIRDLLLHHQETWPIETFCTYTGYKKSYVYKMISQKKINHYKSPGGSKITFKRAEVIEFMTSIKIKSGAELDKEAEALIKLKQK